MLPCQSGHNKATQEAGRMTALASLSPAELSVVLPNLSAVASGTDAAPRVCLSRHGAAPQSVAAVRRRVLARGAGMLL